MLAAGTETAVKHARGLGLWLARWGAERVGGTLTFEHDDGGVVTVTVPARHVDT